MLYLNDIQIARHELGYQLLILLNPGWQEAAKKYPLDKLEIALKPQIDFGNELLRPLRQIITPRASTEGLGLQALELGDRVGLDLSSSYQYISHNFTQQLQVAAVIPVMLRYIRDLEIINKPKLS